VKRLLSCFALSVLAGTVLNGHLFYLVTILKRSCTVMTMKTVTSLALAAGCALALAIPAAQAQMVDTQVLSTAPRVNAGDRAGWLAARNNAESAQYDRLLEVSPGFRHARVRRECGPITDPQLRQNCFASFAEYEPSMGSRSRTMASTSRWNRSAGAYNTQEGLTGSSTGTMTSTTGYNYTTPTNSFGASRNLPGEYSSGMVQAPGAMPNYPGPRPSGPLSGGGGAGGGGAGSGR
jgi:hypothetical protein